MLRWQFRDGSKSYFLINKMIREEKAVVFKRRGSKEMVKAPLSGEGNATHWDENGKESIIDVSTLLVNGVSYLEAVKSSKVLVSIGREVRELLTSS